MSFAFGDLFGGGGTDYAAIAAQQEAARQNRITQGTTDINNAFAGFTPQFYQNYANAYTQNEQPQLAQQYQDTSNTIGFNLANRGLTRSGTANSQWDDLATTMGEAQRQVSDQGTAAAQNLQTQVESSKTNELNTLYNSADPAAAQSSAIATAGSFGSTPALANLSNMFGDLLNKYYTGQLINNYNTSLASLSQTFGSSAGFAGGGNNFSNP